MTDKHILTLRSRLVAVLFPLLLPFLVQCSSGSSADYTVSSLNRPTAIGVAVLEWELSDEEFSEEYADSWESCLGLPYRAFAFIPNSGGDSVAKIDLCAAEVKNTMQAGNPYVISHIPVGKMPTDVAVSLDRRRSRVLVANNGEESLSIIDSYASRTLPFKAELKGRPGRLVMAPDAAVEEGMALVTLPMYGEIAVVRKGSDAEGNERWAQERTISLQLDGYAAPKLGPLALSPNGTKLYVADMAASYFYVVDLNNPDHPPLLRDVNGPQRNIAVSPDGRWIYLSKLDTRRVAVFDTAEDRYVDTNQDLQSHRNAPPPSDLVSYDIDLQSYPRQVVFADVAKTTVTEPVDGDTEWDGEDESETDTDGDVEDEGENEEGEVEEDEEKEDEPLRLVKLRDETTTTEEEEEEEEENAKARLYAYTIGYNGSIQLIDLEDRMHKLYDSTGGNSPSLSLVVQDELQIDNGQCLADIEWDLPVGSTQDALWELVWQGTVTQDDGSISGVLDTKKNRLYDANVKFTDYPALHARSSTLPGDWIVVTTEVLRQSDGRSFCMETVTDDDGGTTLLEVQQVKLEVTAVTEEYLEFDPRTLRLEECFASAVSYVLRSNDNYLVYMTELDSQNVPISDRMYQGRAKNAEFVPSDVVQGQEQFDMLSFQTEDYSSYICLQETENEETGETEKIYRFRMDMTLNQSGETVRGMRCRAPWLDGFDREASFENEWVSVAICQDLENDLIKTKRLDSYVYSFVTKSGLNEIVAITVDGAVDKNVGVLLEDAMVSMAYKDFPRLYVVDSSEGIVWVIDLLTDTVVDSIL